MIELVVRLVLLAVGLMAFFTAAFLLFASLFAEPPKDNMPEDPDDWKKYGPL